MSPYLAFADEFPGFLFGLAAATDLPEFAQDLQASPAVYAKFGGQLILQGSVGNGIEVLDGSSKYGALVVARFEKLADIEPFWSSGDFPRFTHIGEGATHFHVVGLQGTGEAPYETDKGVPPAYLFTLVKVKDRDKAAAYVKAISEYAASAPNRVLARSGPDDFVVLKGSKPDFSLEVSSWPSLAAVREFVADPRFRGAENLRTEALEFVLIAVEAPTMQRRESVR